MSWRLARTRCFVVRGGIGDIGRYDAHGNTAFVRAAWQAATVLRKAGTQAVIALSTVTRTTPAGSVLSQLVVTDITSESSR
jgi:hypothetical protein